MRVSLYRQSSEAPAVDRLVHDCLMRATKGGNQKSFLEVSLSESSVLTSIFADARFFLMTLFSEYCSVAMMACATNKGLGSSRDRTLEGVR